MTSIYKIVKFNIQLSQTISSHPLWQKTSFFNKLW